MPDPPCLIRTYLLETVNIKDPRSFFDLFLKNEDFDIITANINNVRGQAGETAENLNPD
jgi:hypothetical protein